MLVVSALLRLVALIHGTVLTAWGLAHLLGVLRLHHLLLLHVWGLLLRLLADHLLLRLVWVYNAHRLALCYINTIRRWHATGHDRHDLRLLRLLKPNHIINRWVSILLRLWL